MSRSAFVGLSLLLCACFDDLNGVADSDGGTDAEQHDTGEVPLWNTDLHCNFDPQRVIPAGMFFGDSHGCNQCGCLAFGTTPFCDGSTCLATCTTADCEHRSISCDGGADAGLEDHGPIVACVPRGPNYPRCRSHEECGPGEPSEKYHVCMFDPGCSDPLGYCTEVQNTCNRSAPPPAESIQPEEFYFCGCDAVTYRGRCSTIPYDHTGPCP
jgi:hypothetical protein